MSGLAEHMRTNIGGGITLLDHDLLHVRRPRSTRMRHHWPVAFSCAGAAFQAEATETPVSQELMSKSAARVRYAGSDGYVRKH
jgi:hypothetical protein